MEFILNVLFAFAAGFGTEWLLGRMSVPDPLKAVLAVIVGIVVFFANFAARVLA